MENMEGCTGNVVGKDDKAKELLSPVEEEKINHTSRASVWNVGLLSFCFGMGWAMLFVQVGTTTVAAKQWASTAFGTVPYGFLAGSHALSALPAQMLMRHFGARPGYVLGGVMGCIGNIICVFAARSQSPLLLCVGAPFCGIANAYANFLRFEPVRFVSKRRISTAISAVVAGGVIGGGMGPVLSRFTRETLSHEFEGTYLISACIWVLEVFLVSLVQFKPPAKPTSAHGKPELHNAPSGGSSFADEGPASVAVVPRPSSPGTTQLSTSVTLVAADETHLDGSGSRARPLVEILKQPSYIVAIVSGTVAYTSMATVMLAALLAMKAVQPGSREIDLRADSGLYTFDDAQNAILLHVEAMFVPSFFSGFIIGWLGPALANLVGFSVLLAGTFLFLAGTRLWVFFLALGLVGFGWNLAFVGATTLVAMSHAPSEKDKVQGFNDMCIFGVNTVISATSSLVLQELDNWNTFVLLYGGLTIPGFLVAGLFWLCSKKHRS